MALIVLGLLTFAAPTSASSAVLAYDCVNGNDHTHFTMEGEFGGDVTSLASGQAAPLTTKAVLTVSESFADQVRLFGGAWLGGSGTLTQTVDGAVRSVPVAFPRTPVSTNGTSTFVATGPAGDITGGPAGSPVVLAVGGYHVDIFVYSSTGTLLGGVPADCVQQAGQDPTVDKVPVVPAATSTVATLAAPTEPYGGQAAITADVTRAFSTARPDGTVVFTLDGRAVTAPVVGGHASTTLPPASVLGPRSVTATFTPADPSLTVSQGTAGLDVVRDGSTTTMTARYRKAHHRFVVKTRVAALHGSGVTGSVKVVLKRFGIRIRKVILPLDGFPRARTTFKGVQQAGKYAVVVRYLGSPTLRRSTAVKHFSVKGA